jgi:hypothetical protein
MPVKGFLTSLARASLIKALSKCLVAALKMARETLMMKARRSQKIYREVRPANLVSLSTALIEKRLLGSKDLFTRVSTLQTKPKHLHL